MKLNLVLDNVWCVCVRACPILGGKLASLEEFKVQKEDLMAKMAALDEALKEQEKGHDEDIYKLERKQVVDKDR